MLNFDEKKFFQPKPPEKPTFFGCNPSPMSMPEKVHDTAVKLAETLERLKMFETSMHEKYDNLMATMTQDNVLFKDLMNSGWSEFVATVSAEVNLFETTIQQTLKLFEESTNADIARHLERIEQAETYMKINLNATLENLIHEMENSGELVGVLDSDIMSSVKRYGAVGDGETDDTAAFIRAIQDAPNRGNVIYVPPGRYMVSSDLEITTHGLIIRGAKGAIIERMPSTSGEYAVFKVEASEDVHFENLEIRGERTAHTGTSGEWGMGISFLDSSECSVDNCDILYCWGDGIYIGGNHGICRNITVNGCTITGNRRNGLSVISVNGLRVHGCRIESNGGTAPEYGICFECNKDSESVVNVSVDDCSFMSNKYGVGFSGADNVYEVVVSNCRFADRNGVFICRTTKENVGGFIIVRGCVFTGNMGVVSDCKTPAGIPVIIEDCQFFCTSIPVRLGYAEMNVADTLGGFDISKCTFVGWDAEQFPVVIRAGDNAAASYSDIRIDARIHPKTHSMIFVSSPNTGNLNVTRDTFENRTLSADAVVSAGGLFTRADINCSNGAKTITLNESIPYGFEMEFRVAGSNAYGVTFALENGIFAQSGDSASSITVKGIYTTVKIRHEAPNRWSFNKITG